MTDTSEMVKDLRATLEARKGQRDLLQKSINELQLKIRKEKRSWVRHNKALVIVRQVGLATQKQLEYHLAEQVSLAMLAVFDDPYELVVNFQEKREKTEVELLFSRRGVCYPPIGNVGGGVIDIASLALRIAYLSMRQDKKVRPVLLLDEPFSRLKGEDANRRALAVVREMSKRLGIQIIMISDERISREDIFRNADRVFHVSRGKDGVSKVVSWEGGE